MSLPSPPSAARPQPLRIKARSSRMRGTPLITIGIPAYNAQVHLAEAIDSLLAQTFTNFELIISDNASTDATREIAESYCQRDSRVRYHRQPSNIGANGNYAALVRLARARFFKWSSASDWCAPTFLERCLATLLTHSDTVLVVPRTRVFIDTPGNFDDYADDLELLDAAPSARLLQLVRELALNNAMNGLIRSDALRDTRALPAYLGADIVLMGELALRGKFRLVDERLFYRRMDASGATALRERSAVWQHHYPTQSIRTLFQATQRQLGWFRAALSTPLTAIERARTLLLAARCGYWDRAAFGRDILGAWRYVVRRRWPD